MAFMGMLPKKHASLPEIRGELCLHRMAFYLCATKD